MFRKLRVAAALVALTTVLIAARGASTESFYPEGAFGYDVSFPQCGQSLPSDGAFAVVGVTNGLAWSANPCLGAQYAWADSKPFPPSFYTNTGNPGPQSTRWGQPGPRTCANPSSANDEGCAYNYGYNAAGDAFQVATNTVGLSNARAAFWWLDVETANSWNGSWASNTAAINGWLDYLHAAALGGVGIYSTPQQWGQITGGATGNVFSWLAGSITKRGSQLSCTGTLTGGATLLTQRVVTLDVNEACARPIPSGAVAGGSPTHLTAPPQKRPKATPTPKPSRERPTPTSTATPKRGDPVPTPRKAQ